MLVYIVIMGVLTACTGSPSVAPAPSPGSNTAGGSRVGVGLVTAQGLDITFAGIHITAGADVAPQGAKVTAAATAEPPGLADNGAELIGEAIELGIEGALQPKSPMTLSISAPASRPGYVVGLLTRESGGGAWRAVPVTSTPGQVEAKITHLSGFAWVWSPEDLVRGLTTYVQRTLSLTYAPPDCWKKPLTLNGRVYTASATNDGVYACVTAVNGKVRITLHSNTAFVWRVRPDANAVGLTPTTDADVSDMLTLAVWMQLQGHQVARQTLLTPGGVAPVELVAGATSAQVGAVVDPHLGWLNIFYAGLQELGIVVGKANPLDKLGCFADVIEASQGTDLASEAASLTQGVLDCAGDQASGPVQMVLALVGTLTGLLVTQFAGIIRELDGTSRSIITVTSTPAQPQVDWDPTHWRIGWGFVGPLKIGMTSENALARGLVTRVTDWCPSLKYGPSERMRGLFGGVGDFGSDTLIQEWRFGQSPDKLDNVTVTDPRVATTLGVRAGDRRSKVDRLHGPLTPVRNLLDDPETVPMHAAVFGPEGYALVFFFDGYGPDSRLVGILATRGTTPRDLDIPDHEC